MTRRIATLGLLALLGGCDAAEYYPNHETPLRAADLNKGGPDLYGGNNANYPVGTPGTTGQPPQAPQPLTTTVPTQAGPTLNTNGSGTFPVPGSYSGTGVGGVSQPGSPSVPVDGTTTLGTGR